MLLDTSFSIFCHMYVVNNGKDDSGPIQFIYHINQYVGFTISWICKLYWFILVKTMVMWSLASWDKRKSLILFLFEQHWSEHNSNN